MSRVIAIIVLAAFLPMQAASAEFDGFRSDTQYERFFPRPADTPQKQSDQNLSETNLKDSQKGAAAERSGTNWLMWGGIGLAAVLVGAIAISSGGGKGGGSTGGGSGGNAATTTVTGSW